MPLYKKIFLDALLVLKRYKIIGIFGFFALIFGGSVEGDIYYNFINTDKNSIYDLANRLSSGLFNKENLLNLPNNLINSASSAGSLWLTALMVIVIIVIILVLSVASHMIVIERAGTIIKSPKANLSSLKDLFFNYLSQSRAAVIKLSLANIVFKLFLILSFFIISSPLLFSSGLSNIPADFSYLILFVLFLPIIILASVYLRYLMISLTLNKNSFKIAATDAWALLNKNRLLSLEFSISVFIFSILVIFLTLLIINGLSIILFFLALAAQNFSYQAYVIVVALSYLVMFTIFLLSNALVSAFMISAWTSLYLELSKKASNNSPKGFIGSINTKLD